VNIAKMTSLRLYMGGPVSDITSYVREDVRAAQGPGDGRSFWTFAGTIPATATGSWQFGIEGYNTVTVLAGTTKERSIRDYGKNALFYAKVGGGTATPRRTVVTTANCNKCHYALEMHGGNRNDARMCTFCHSSALVSGGKSYNYVNMVHRVHSAEIGYPGRLQTCTQCHAAGTMNLPLSDSLLNVTNPAGLVTPTPPSTNACLSCHNTKAAWSHAVGNTTTLGESCAVCHGGTADYSVAKVHAQ
jgi:OmcA/MtrC family decaheme c-type cytochrome